MRELHPLWRTFGANPQLLNQTMKYLKRLDVEDARREAPRGYEEAALMCYWQDPGSCQCTVHPH